MPTQDDNSFFKFPLLEKVYFLSYKYLYNDYKNIDNYSTLITSITP